MLLKHLQQSGVSTEWVRHLERDTTLAFVSADSADGEVEYAFYGRETADRSLEKGDLPQVLPEEIKALQFGSVSLVLEPTASTMELLMKREAGQRMLSDGKGGSIINLSSVAGLNGMRGMPAAYQATKGAVATLTKSLAVNWADRGVRVNAIAPGWFPSQMTMAWVRKSTFKNHISSSSPMGRIGKPEELNGALLLLASEASSFINGEIISVDGGINASVGLPFFTEEMFTYLEKAVPNDMAKRIVPDES